MALDKLFRIFYTTFYSILNFILLILLLITPADAIHQAVTNGQFYNVFVIAGCYVLTLIAALMIYAWRLYASRSVLATIPKTWIPVEKGDVGPSTRIMIASSLSRSAVSAWHSRPRVLRHETLDVEAEEANATYEK